MEVEGVRSGAGGPKGAGQMWGFALGRLRRAQKCFPDCRQEKEPAKTRKQAPLNGLAIKYVEKENQLTLEKNKRKILIVDLSEEDELEWMYVFVLS